MPVVIVEMWAGRNLDQKRQLVEGITESFTKIGTAADDGQIIIKDNAKDNWAIGGRLASERG